MAVTGTAVVRLLLVS